MGKTYRYNGVTVSTMIHMLFRLGFEPAVKAYGGPDRPAGPFKSFNCSKGCWIKEGGAARWSKVTKKLVTRDWGRQCLQDVGLPSRDDWQAAWKIENDDSLRILLAKRIHQEYVEQGNSLDDIQNMLEETTIFLHKLKSIKVETQSKSVLRLKAIAENCKKLHLERKQRYLDRVEEAEDRKRAWLTPLMWEALFNQQHHRHNRNKKINFYKQAKATPCFDCGKQFAPAVMTYDHLRDKDFTLGHLRQTEWRISWRRLHQEIGKCDVVCRDCHDIREYLRGTHNFAWEDLSPEIQQRISKMCYVERQILFKVINRETKNPSQFDAESLRQVSTRWQRLQNKIGNQDFTIRKLTFWEKVGRVLENNHV